MKFRYIYLSIVYFIGLCFLISSCKTVSTRSDISSVVPSGKKNISLAKDSSGEELIDPRKMPAYWESMSLSDKENLDNQILARYGAITPNTLDPKFYYELGLLLYRRCRLEESAQAFEKAIGLDANSGVYYYYLGSIYFFSKRYDLVKNNIRLSNQLGFEFDQGIAVFFYSTCPDNVDLIRAKIKMNLEKPYNKRGLYIKNLNEALCLPEEEIDLATFSLLLSNEASEKLFREPVDVKKYRGAIDEMVNEILKCIGGEVRPEWIVGSINKYLFMENKYNAPLPDGADKDIARYNLINCVIDKRKGVCMSLSMLYLSIAERLRLPVYGVVVPGHFFIRYDDMINSINIETTAFGKQFTNDYYRDEFPNLNTSEPLYFKNLNKREALACYLNNFAAFYSQIKLYDDAIKLLKMAISIEPRFSEPYANLGNVYGELKKYDLAISIFKEGLKYNGKNNLIMKNLGKAYFLSGDIDNALEELKMSSAINDKDSELHSLMGEIYRKKGYFDEAILSLRRALAYLPESSDLNYHLAIAYYQARRYDEAWKQVKILRKQNYRVDQNFINLLEKSKREPAG